jgi:sigma-B regulation protein RsbU (phosphoserine phosphatase)
VLAIMASVGSQISQFIERREAERALYVHERELSLARAIQQDRLPEAALTLAGFDIGGGCRPAQETGGDYWDLIPMSDGALAIAIGDASGHGMAAALLITETRAYLRALARTCPDPGGVLTLVNRHLTEEVSEGHFVTLFLARLDLRMTSLVYGSAGHLPCFLLDTCGEVKARLESTSLPLGLDRGAVVPSASAPTLAAGELVLLFSDGILDAFSPQGQQFGTGRVLRTVRAHREEPAGAIVTALLEEVDEFTHSTQIDDMTAVVIKVTSNKNP